MHPSVFLYYGDHEHVSNNWSNHNDHESRHLEPYLYVDERTGRTSIGGLWFWCGIGTCVIWHSNLPEMGGKTEKLQFSRELINFFKYRAFREACLQRKKWPYPFWLYEAPTGRNWTITLIIFNFNLKIAMKADAKFKKFFFSKPKALIITSFLSLR